jgi:hypothetical protein
MSDNFGPGFENLKGSIAYGLCVGLSTAGGIAAGSFVAGPPGAVVGGGAMLVMSLQACKAVEPALKRKLFDARQSMTEAELRQLAVQTARAYPHMSQKQVLDLLAAARIAAKREPARYRC